LYFSLLHFLPALRYMAPQGFPERDIALHAAVLRFPHPVRTREAVVCVAAVPAHWGVRYGAEVTAEVDRLSEELRRREHSSPR
jgi:hypothetical protein